MLSDDENVGWHVADCSALVNNTTGVEDLMAQNDRVWVEGRTLCIDTHFNGPAMVAAVNGTTCDLSLTAGVNRYNLEPGIYVVVLNGKSYKIAIR